MKLDPRHLEILAAIVDSGGLTEGAQSLGKSQPSVSRSLAMLEARLGVPLFKPGKKPLQPTPFCLSLAQEGRKIRAAGDAASKLIAQSMAGARGAVHVMGTPIFMDGVVSPVLAAFQSQFPDLQINQSYGYMKAVLEQLSNEVVDVGIGPIRLSEAPRNIEVRQLLAGKNVIACRIGHPLARKKQVTISEIAEYSWIAPPPESPLYQDLRMVLSSIGISDFKVSFSGGSLASISHILQGSDALTVLPSSVTYLLRHQRNLATLSIPIGDPDRHLCLMSLKSKGKQASTANFIDFVTHEFAAMQSNMNAIP